MANGEKEKQEIKNLPSSAPQGRDAAGSPLSPVQPARKKLGRKGLVFLLIFLILMITVGVVVPVGKIPLLRNMVWLMGYTPEDTEHISLLKALFSWGDKESLRASISAGNMYSVFDRSGNGAAGYSAGGPRSGLFNIRAVNDSLARQGKKGDWLAGENTAQNGPNAKGSDVKIPAGKLAAGTQSNSAVQKEVFFGSESPNIPRDKKDGFDTTGAIKKAGNIVGAGKIDWMGSLLDKATLQNTKDLDEALKGDGRSSLTTLSAMGDVGDQKARKDLNFAFLVGKAAQRSTKPILRKTLAAASWNGAEMPKKVFDTTGSSGIGVDPNSVVGDVGDIKMKLQNEKLCNEATESEGAKIKSTMDDAVGIINGLKNSFPGSSCDDAALGAWEGQIGSVEGKCKDSAKSYTTIGTVCKVSIPNKGGCDAVRLRDMASTQREKCAALVAEAQKKADEEAAANGTTAAPVDPKTLDPKTGSEDVPGTGYDQEEVDSNVNNQFNVGLDGKNGNDGDNFFSRPGGSSSDDGGDDAKGLLEGLLEGWK